MVRLNGCEILEEMERYGILSSVEKFKAADEYAVFEALSLQEVVV